MPYIEQLAQQLGNQAGQGVVGSIMGLALEKHNDKRQLEQQEKLGRQQLGFNKEMTNYQYEKQLQMWKDTGYVGQMEQLEKAGLNPGLLYGMGGAGGATTGGGAASNGGAGHAPSGGGEIMGIMGGMMNMAQIDMLKAQAENIRADTAMKTGVETDLKRTQIANLTASTGNTQADTVLKNIEKEILQIEANYRMSEKELNVEMLTTRSTQMFAELDILQNERIISENTKNERIDIIKAELAGLYLRNKATQAGINLTQTQIQGIVQSIQTQIKQLQQGDRALDQKDKDQIIDKERNRLIEKGIEWGAGAKVLGDVLDLAKPKIQVNNKGR